MCQGICLLTYLSRLGEQDLAPSVCEPKGVRNPLRVTDRVAKASKGTVPPPFWISDCKELV